MFLNGEVCGEVRSRGVPAQIKPVRIPAKASGVVVHKGEGALECTQHVRQAHGRKLGKVHHHRRKACGHERRSDEGEVILCEIAPGAAVDKEQDGAVTAASRKYVQDLLITPPIAQRIKVESLSY